MDRRCKVTVKIRSLWRSWRHVRGMKVQLHAFFMSALDGRESSATQSRRFTHRNTPRGKQESKFCGLSRRCRHSGEEERFIAPVSYRAAVLRESSLCPIHYTDWDNPHRKQKRLWHNFRFSTILQINWTDWEKLKSHRIFGDQTSKIGQKCHWAEMSETALSTHVALGWPTVQVSPSVKNIRYFGKCLGEEYTKKWRSRKK